MHTSYNAASIDHYQASLRAETQFFSLKVHRFCRTNDAADDYEAYLYYMKNIVIR